RTATRGLVIRIAHGRAASGGLLPQRCCWVPKPRLYAFARSSRIALPWATDYSPRTPQSRDQPPAAKRPDPCSAYSLWVRIGEARNEAVVWRCRVYLGEP